MQIHVTDLRSIKAGIVNSRLHRLISSFPISTRGRNMVGIGTFAKAYNFQTFAFRSAKIRTRFLCDDKENGGIAKRKARAICTKRICRLIAHGFERSKTKNHRKRSYIHSAHNRNIAVACVKIITRRDKRTCARCTSRRMYRKHPRDSKALRNKLRWEISPLVIKNVTFRECSSFFKTLERRH